MPDTRIGNLHLSPTPLRVQTVGTQPGPPLGEGWSLVASLPYDTMPAGSGQYAVVVSGKIGDLLVAGSTPSSGVMQLCLGTTSQVRLAHLRFTQTLTNALGSQEGIPFQFLLIVSASDPDPVLGASFTPDPLTEFVLWGRTYLNGDPQTYYAEFSVADLSWLWFDLARIPSGDWQFTELDTLAGFPVADSNTLRGLSPTVGNIGETWLHFGNVWYEPRQHLGQAPRFKMGMLPEGTPSVTQSCTITTLLSGTTARITTTAGTFLTTPWQPGSAVNVAGSALGLQGSGGNNSRAGTAQRVTARAVDGSWIELAGTFGTASFVAEGPRSFTLTAWLVETMIGNGGRWGQNQHPATLSFVDRPQIQQGGFWPFTNTSSQTKAGFEGWETITTNPGGIFKRWRHLAIRIDDLPDVHVDSIPGPSDGGVRLLNNWQDYYQTVERPALAQLLEPIIMVHQVASIAGARGAYGSRVVESSGTPSCTETIFGVFDANRGEAVSAMVFGRRQFQPLSPAIQWRSHLVGSDNSPAGVQQVYDFHFVAFHPVLDPSNTTDPPGSSLPPIVLSPGTQGPLPSSLPEPPTQPNANHIEVGENVRPQIRGATGYRRSWPVGSRPLRKLPLSWGPLPEAEAAALFEFLRDNPVWRYAPPRSADHSVMSTSRPVMTPASHRSFTVSIDVVILVWTGD